MKILITGSIAYDILLGYDGSFADAVSTGNVDKLSVSFFSPHFARHHGGTATNIAWNLKLLGGDPLIVGTVGNDGGEYLALLEERGIETRLIEALKEHVTATAIIGTDNAERQIAFFHPGADAHGKWEVSPDERDDVAYAIVGARNALLMMEAVRWCQKYGVRFVFDPGQQLIALSRDELISSAKGSAAVIVNEYEWELLRERTGFSETSILAETAMLVVTRGERGITLFLREGGKTDVPACKADRVVNPTGAGDAFRSGFLAGLAKQWSPVDACRLGAAMGSFVVEQEGTLLDGIRPGDVVDRAQVAYGTQLPRL